MVNIETGVMLHSAKMKLNAWSEYEQKLPVFASECVRTIPIPNYFIELWSGTLSNDEFEDYYEITFFEKSKCIIKVTSTNSLGIETVQETQGTYSYNTDALSGGKIFRLNAVFKGDKSAHLQKIEWTYPIYMNSEKNTFSINICPYPNKDTLLRLTLTKME